MTLDETSIAALVTELRARLEGSPSIALSPILQELVFEIQTTANDLLNTQPPTPSEVA